jgi:hypothetical protein
MALNFLTGLSRIDQDRADYTVFCGEWNIGRIYDSRRSRQSRWFWSMTVSSAMTRSDRVATLGSQGTIRREAGKPGSVGGVGTSIEKARHIGAG